MDAWERDARELPARRGFHLDADAAACGASFGKLISSEPGKLVVDGGDYFCQQPSFSLHGGWLLATDPESGYRVGFQLATPALRKSIESRELWLLFSNRWFAGFEAQVIVEA